MNLEEFESHTQKAIAAFTAVRKLVQERDLGESKLTEEDRHRIEELQDEAAEALGAIDHIIDRFGNRVCVFGPNSAEVDMFRESLAITGGLGSRILDSAIAELRLLLPRIRGRVSTLSAQEVSRLLSGDTLSEKTDAAERAIESGKPVDVFISYSAEDREVAEDLANRLRALQLIVFMAHDTITTGPTWRSQIGVALRRCKVAVLLFSANSLQSDWVRYEIGAIWALNKPAAPALLDCDVTQLPELVRDFQARSVATTSDRTVFCYEMERLVRETQTNDIRNA